MPSRLGLHVNLHWSALTAGDRGGVNNLTNDAGRARLAGLLTYVVIGQRSDEQRLAPGRWPWRQEKKLRGKRLRDRGRHMHVADYIVLGLLIACMLSAAAMVLSKSH
jgi:hypothetical protein